MSAPTISIKRWNTGQPRPSSGCFRPGFCWFSSVSSYLHLLTSTVSRGRSSGSSFVWVVGGALAGVALWRRVNPGKPLFTLSPAGIHYRVPMVKEVLIPWQEIQGVDTIDIEAGYWSMRSALYPIPSYNTWVVRDVTVILLPKPFYDRRIFVDLFLLRGPGWNANFILKGALVQMALHHELVSVEPRPLREAVEARWLAFRDRPAAAPARTSVPGVWRQRAIRTRPWARRPTPRRRQAPWRWGMTRRPCHRGRPQRSSSR